MTKAERSAPEGAPAEAWVEKLSQFLLDHDEVEAIQLRPDEQRVAVATLGQVDEEVLHQRLSELLKDLDAKWLSDSAVSEAVGNEDVHLHPGLVTMRHQGEKVVFEKPSCPTAPKFWKWRDFDWPSAEEIEQKSHDEWQALALQAAICGVTLVSGFVLGKLGLGPEWLPQGLFVISIVAGGWDAAKDAWENLWEARLDVHFLMLAVAGGAMSIGAWEEGALLLFLFSTSGALEHYVMHRTHREIRALTQAAPKLARVRAESGAFETRDVNRLRVGDVIEVRPDELFAVDGRVIEGETAVDEANLTGESVPVEKGLQNEVFGGTLNLWGRVLVEVERPVSQSALQKIISLIETAQHMRAPSQRFTDRFGTRYTVATLALVAVMFFVWWLGFGIRPFHQEADVNSAFYRAMTLLVVMSPCALVLSIPSAILAAIAWGARRGVLFRGGAAIEKLAEVDVMAMDKTGTLTKGEPVLAQVESFPQGREDEVLKIAVSMEAGSNHPIARAISEHGRREGIEADTITEFQSITGQGLRGRSVDGVSYVGRRELVKDSPLGPVLDSVPDAPVGYTEVWVLHEQLVGRLLLRDEIREGSAAVLKALHDDGVRTLMLTGDRRAAAAEVAEKIGIDEVRAGLHPEDKVEAIRELTAAGKKVAMVGDGVNDAPSLAAAYVSIAMGARGSDAAMEQSDVVLMQDKIEKLLAARRISQVARRIIRQNLTISLGSVAIMAFAALFGIVPLTLGVLTHEGSTVVVCLNSLRLLFVKEAALKSA